MRAVSNSVQSRVNFNAAGVGAADCYALQRFSGKGASANDGAVQTLPPGVTIDVALLPKGRAVPDSDPTSSAGS